MKKNIMYIIKVCIVLKEKQKNIYLVVRLFPVNEISSIYLEETNQLLFVVISKNCKVDISR